MEVSWGRGRVVVAEEEEGSMGILREIGLGITLNNSSTVQMGWGAEQGGLLMKQV